MMRRARPFRDVALAVTQLTVMPLPVSWPSDERPDVASYYVWVGFLVGAVVYVPLKLIEKAGGWWHDQAMIVAAIVLVVWAVFTRLLHWDALADTADGWFGEDVPERLRMASDSHVGAFGVTAIVLAAVLEFAAMATVLAGHELFLLCVPVFARLAGTFAAWFGTAAKPTGMGASVVGRPSAFGVVATVAGTVVATAGLAYGYGVAGLVICSVVSSWRSSCRTLLPGASAA
jgi:adenosylcobinamide-GDP ribazoletransferase